LAKEREGPLWEKKSVTDSQARSERETEGVQKKTHEPAKTPTNKKMEHYGKGGLVKGGDKQEENL